jgi:hypothetical protein
MGGDRKGLVSDPSLYIKGLSRPIEVRSENEPRRHSTIKFESPQSDDGQREQRNRHEYVRKSNTPVHLENDRINAIS